jgi:hypothetical protein
MNMDPQTNSIDRRYKRLTALLREEENRGKRAAPAAPVRPRLSEHGAGAVACQARDPHRQWLEAIMAIRRGRRLRRGRP